MNEISNYASIASMSGSEFETACRYHTKYAYLGDNIGLCKILTRSKIHVDTRDIGVSPHLIMDGFWETWLTQCLARIVKPGDVCIDLGANFGYYSVLMSALAGNGGRTLAIEPNTELCKLLRRTASIHSHNFEVAEVAVSDHSGEAVLTIQDGFLGNSSLIKRNDQAYTGTSQMKVRMTTLDALLLHYQISKVDVIKMDVEGLEPQIFKGMVQTMAHNPQLKIIVEYSPHLYQDPKTFTEFLFDNFSVSRIKDVETEQQLSRDDLQQLLDLKDHTDLFLQAKEIAAEPTVESDAISDQA